MSLTSRGGRLFGCWALLAQTLRSLSPVRRRCLRQGHVMESARCTLLVVILLGGTSATWAQQVQYVYDELGRLVELVSPDGSSVRYSYDAVGNITSIRKGAASAIAISEFTPNAGPVGSSITIFGTGFSTTAASNTVRFNGTSATVSAATANQLTVTIPAGATTGKIAVTSPNGTATSASDFTISSLPAPTLSSFTPTIGAPSTTVTITGTNFQSARQDNKLTFGGVSSAVSTATSTTLTTLVPTAAASGKIAVTTPFGRAVSTTDFFALPDGIAAADVISTQRIAVNGAAITLNFSAVGKKALLIFDGSVNQFVSLLASNSSFASGAYVKIYRPDGVLLTTLSPGSQQPISDLPRLPLVGTYTMLVDPNAVGAVTLQLQGEKAGAMTVNGSTAISLASGQDGRYTFSAQAGVGHGLALTTLVYTGNGNGTQAITADLVGPNGTVLKSCSFNGDSKADSCDFERALFSVTGVYSLRFSTASTYASSFTAIFSSDAGRSVLAVNAASPTVATIARAGQNASYTFSGTAGQNLSLAITGSTLDDADAGTYNALTVNVYAPSGALRYTTQLQAGAPSGVLDMPLLPETGSYVVHALPAGLDKGTFGVRLAADATGALTIDGSTSIALGSGQNARYSFSAQSGTGYGLALVGLTYGGNGDGSQGVTVYLDRSNGSTAAVCSFSGDGKSDSCDFEPAIFANAGGNYTLRFDPQSTYSTTFSAVLSTDAGRSVLAVNPASSTTASVVRPGQNATYTFSGTAGQNLSLALSGSTFDDADPGTANYTAVQVLAPSGNALYTVGLTTGITAASLDMPNLPQTGVYVVRLLPSGLDKGSIDLRLNSDANGALTVDGSTLISLAGGQNGRYSLSATARTGYGLALTGITYTGSGTGPQQVRAHLINANGQALKSCTFDGSGKTSNCEFEPGLFPNTGSYTVVLDPSSTYATSFTALLSADAGGGALQLNAANPTGVSIVRAGQSASFTFDGTAGQNLSLALTSSTLDDADPGTSNQTYLNIYRPGAGPIVAYSSPTYSTSISTGSPSATLALTNLPDTGLYAVRVLPSGTDVGSLALQLTQAGTTQPATQTVSGSVLIDGTATLANVASGGTGRYTFAGSIGQRLSLYVSSISTTPAGGSIQVSVSYPDNSTILLNCGSAGSELGCNLPPLPSSGTFTIRVEPNSGRAATANLSLSSEILGSLAANAPLPTNVGIGRAGQRARFSLSAIAAQGQSVVLSESTFSSAAISVLDPAGAQVASGFISGTQTVSLGFIPNVTGTYSVIVDPTGAATGAAKIALRSDLVDVLNVNGTPTTLTLASGQNSFLTFSGTAGQHLGLAVNGVSTSPAGSSVTFDIKSPHGGAVGLCGSSSSDACNLGPLPATGTYTLRSKANTAITATATLILSTDLSGSLTGNGSTPTTVTIARAGQNARYTFAATAGAGMSLILSEVSLGSNSRMSVVDPSGAEIFNGVFYPTITSVFDFVPVRSGTHTVVLDPAQDSTGSVTVAVLPDVTGNLTLGATPSAVSLQQAQKTSLTFVGTAGTYVDLRLSDILTEPSDGTATAVVISPYGEQLATCSSASATSCLLPRLWATGTYRIRISAPIEYGVNLKVGVSQR
jgi:large repetitive protein